MTNEKLENRKKALREYWINLKPFNASYDIPKLPVVGKEEWTSFYVPLLIKAGAIPKKDLVHGVTYIGNCRNSSEAMWDSKDSIFIYKRTKFNIVYDDTINHFEDDNGFDLFVPIKKLET